ncbi:MAG: sugar phosphate isomerase/epimerase, partial [Methylobacteriaceae bacterium]|nr:sugar phosphate isomerase/epimerase [Methylobacteriaceae bacterium]
MMQVGIFNGYFPYTLKEQAQKIKAIGFNTVQLDLAFKDIDFSTPEAITREKARRVRETFRDHDMPICTISGYTNIVHPDH